jgi:CDP-Glycerol:Poly(glycerophosphate) glycerophosphotransferase
LADLARKPGRTILLALPTGHNVANIVESGVLKTLLEDHELKIIIVTPLPSTAIERAAGRPVTVEPLHAYQPGRVARAIDSIVSEQFLQSSRLVAVKLQRNRARLLRPKPPAPAVLLAKAAVTGLPVPRRAWFAVMQRVDRRRRYADLFARHAPDLLVTCTAGFVLAEMPLIYAAKRFRVPQMAIDLGWDNLSSKYHTILPIDRLVVWNRQMRDEAVRYHAFADSQIDVAGAPQFDRYFTRRDLPTREQFFTSVGADPTKRLVTLATTAAGTYSGTPAIVRVLSEAASASAFGQRVQILVRLHPRDVLETYREVSHLPGVILDRRVQRLESLEASADFDGLVPNRDDRAHLAATLAYSDVLINFASTTTVEACIFDTPVVNIGFDPAEGAPLALSIRRYFAYEHYQPVLEAQAVRIAPSPDSLIEDVAAYLADPTLDRVGRQRVVRDVCGFTDGRSTERVARAVLDFLRDLAPSRPELAIRQPS